MQRLARAARRIGTTDELEEDPDPDQELAPTDTDVNGWKCHPLWRDEQSRCESLEWFKQKGLGAATPQDVDPDILGKWIHDTWVIDHPSEPTRDFQMASDQLVKDQRENVVQPQRTQWYDVDTMPMDPAGGRMVPRLMWEHS